MAGNTQTLQNEIISLTNDLGLEGHDRALQDLTSHPISHRIVDLIDKLKSGENREAQAECDNMLRASLVVVCAMCRHAVNELTAAGQQVSPPIVQTKKSLEDLLNMLPNGKHVDEVEPAKPKPTSTPMPKKKN